MALHQFTETQFTLFELKIQFLGQVRITEAYEAQHHLIQVGPPFQKLAGNPFSPEIFR